MTENIDFDFYVCVDLQYRKLNSGMKENELFPVNWFDNSNYKLMSSIILEAIKAKILIKDTDLYKKSIMN